MTSTRQVPLVGRRAELTLVEEAIEQAEAGIPGLVAIGGEAGVGKTFLMGHVAARFQEADSYVINTTCVELGTHGLPLAPATAALRQIVRLIDADTLRRTIPG